MLMSAQSKFLSNLVLRHVQNVNQQGLVAGTGHCHSPDFGGINVNVLSGTVRKHGVTRQCLQVWRRTVSSACVYTWGNQAECSLSPSCLLASTGMTSAAQAKLVMSCPTHSELLRPHYCGVLTSFSLGAASRLRASSLYLFSLYMCTESPASASVPTSLALKNLEIWLNKLQSSQVTSLDALLFLLVTAVCSAIVFQLAQMLWHSCHFFRTPVANLDMVIC